MYASQPKMPVLQVWVVCGSTLLEWWSNAFPGWVQYEMEDGMENGFEGKETGEHTMAIGEQVATVLQEILWVCLYLWIMTDNEDDKPWMQKRRATPRRAQYLVRVSDHTAMAHGNDGM